MKTIGFIGDTHLDNRFEGYLQAQVDAIKVFCRSNFDALIFLGDITERRKPTPTVLLAIKELFKSIKKPVYILRGNHDSENKADDGITYLSLFESDNIKIITHEERVNICGQDFTLIPHYENQQKIIDKLAKVPEGDWVVGHFGFDGCINSVGDWDFSIPIDSFRNPTILGHIHKFHQNGLITVLGTPYATSYQEAGHEAKIASLQLYDKPQLRLYPFNEGPRYLTYKLSELESKKQEILSSDRYTILRVLIDPGDKNDTPDLIKNIIEEYKVNWVDKKFLTHDIATIKNHSPYLGEVPKFDDQLLNSYLANLNLPYPEQDIMKVYKELKVIDEN